MTPLRGAPSLLLALPVVLAAAGAAGAEEEARPQPEPPPGEGEGFTLVPLPVLFYSPETRLGFGGLLQTYFRPGGTEHSRRRPSSLSALFIYTLNEQIAGRLLGEVYSPRGTWRYTAGVGGARFPDKFWGIGNETPEEAEEDYTPRTLDAAFGAQRKIAGPWFLGAEATWARRELEAVEPDGILAGPGVPGTNDGDLVALGTGLRRDTRDYSVSPSSGGTLDLSARFHHGALGSEWAYDRYAIDARRYGGAGPFVLAGRVFGIATKGEVPFDRLPQLGGDSLLRGYWAGRYRDRHLLALQLEARFPVWWRFSGAVFGAAGQVAPELRGFGVDRFHPAAGFGLRVLANPEERLNLRIDWGVGEDDQSGLYFSLGEAF